MSLVTNHHGRGQREASGDMEDQEGERKALLLPNANFCCRCLLAEPTLNKNCGLLQLIKALENARGNGTSMISLIMPPKDQVCGLLLWHCISLKAKPW